MTIKIVGAFLILSTISSATEIVRNEADTIDYLLSHLKITEEVVQKLFGRIERLESENKAQQQMITNQQSRIEQLERRDYDQQQLITNTNKQLAAQRHRTNSLERLSERMKAFIMPYVRTGQDAKDTIAHSNKDSNGRVTEHSQDDKVSSVAGMKGAYARIRRAENEQNIAFFASLSNHLSHAGVGQTFIFDRVVTNLGNGYNHLSGNFVAPVSGTYVFSATLTSLYHKNAHSKFMKNGNVVSYLYVSGAEAGYDTTSQTIVLELQKGDDIFIQNTDVDAGYLGTHYSTFSGFLLEQNFSNNVVVGRK